MRSKKPGWRKKMESIGALIAVVVGLLTIIGYFTGAFDKLYHHFADEIRIVVREQRFLPGAASDQFHLVFSLVNVAKQPIYVNALTLQLGDYTTGGPPPTMMIIVKTFSKQLSIRFVKDLRTGGLMPIVREAKSPSTMGTKVYSLLGNDRVALEPMEQVDIKLEIDLERPEDLAGKYDSIWKLGGAIQLDYERADLKRGSARYPHT